MTTDILEARPVARRGEAPPLRLNCSENGAWTLSGVHCRTRQFTDFDAALESARQEPDAAIATIEVWQGADYLCCLPPEERPERPLPAAVVPRQGRPQSAVERYANRAAELLLPAASFFFWVALMAAALAASVGWRFLIF